MIVAFGEIETQRLIDDFLKIAQGKNELNEKNSDYGEFIHRDGWGIAYLTDKWQTYKSTQPIFEDPNLPNFKDLKAKAVIIHARKATQGKIAIENTQPLHYHTEKGDHIFTHNGSIYDNIAAINNIVQGDSDSVKWFNNILNNQSNEIKNKYYFFNKYSSANFFHITPKKIIIGQNYKENPEYFTLKVYKDKDKTIISSEILPTLKDKTWHKLQNQSYLEIDYLR